MFCSRSFLIISLIFSVFHTTFHAMDSRSRILGLQEEADLIARAKAHAAARQAQLRKEIRIQKQAALGLTSQPTEEERKAFGDAKARWALEQEQLHLRELQEELLIQAKAEAEKPNLETDSKRQAADGQNNQQQAMSEDEIEQTDISGSDDIFGPKEQAALLQYVLKNRTDDPLYESIARLITRWKGGDFDGKARFIPTEAEKEFHFARYKRGRLSDNILGGTTVQPNIPRAIKLEFRQMTKREEVREARLRATEAEDIDYSEPEEGEFPWDSDEDTSNDIDYDKWDKEFYKDISDSDEDSDDEAEETNPLKIGSKKIGKALQTSILAHAPQKISTIINTWNGRYTNRPMMSLLSQEERAKREKENAAYQDITKKWLFAGPTGTGKSSIAKAIAGSCNIPFFMYQAAIISEAYKIYGVEILELIVARAVAVNGPCLIIMDQLEALNDDHGKLKSDMLKELHVILDRYDDHPILFIGTLNSDADKLASIKKHFDQYVVNTSLPDINQRQAIISYYIDQLYAGCANDISIEELAQKTEGFSHAGLKELMEESRNIKRWMRQPILHSHVRCLYSKTFGKCISETIGITDVMVKKPDTTVTMKECLKALKTIERAKTLKKWKARWDYFSSSPLINYVVLPVIQIKTGTRFPRVSQAINAYNILKNIFKEDDEHAL